MNVELQYHDVPPSMNAASSGYRGNAFAGARMKGRWEGIMATMLMTERVPRHLVRVHARASLRFPTRRRRDEGNYRMLLEKALGDALVKGGWIEDDTPDQFRFFQLQFEDSRGPKRTTIFLEIEGPSTGGRSTSTNPGG